MSHPHDIQQEHHHKASSTRSEEQARLSIYFEVPDSLVRAYTAPRYEPSPALTTPSLGRSSASEITPLLKAHTLEQTLSSNADIEYWLAASCQPAISESARETLVNQSNMSAYSSSSQESVYSTPGPRLYLMGTPGLGSYPKDMNQVRLDRLI